MHVPSFINCVIIKPGARLPSPSSVDDLTDITIPYLTSTDNSWQWICDALGGYIYSVTRDKVISEEDVEVDDKGRSIELLFVVTSVADISCGPDRGGLIDCMGDGSWADLENALPELYETAKDWIPSDTDVPMPPWNEDENPHRVFDFPISFIAFWAARGSTDYESGYWELDSIEYVGEGKVVPKSL